MSVHGVLLEALDDLVLDARTKGVPAHLAPLRVADVGARGLNVLRGDLSFPVAVLKRSALDANRAHMRAFLSATKTMIAPHGKTTMAPQLFAEQLEDGAWGITLATVAQLQVALSYGVRRVLLANQLVGEQALRVVMDALASDPACEIVSLVDSNAGVAAVSAAARARGLARPVSLLVEVGFVGGRTGCRTQDEALAVARAIAADPALALVGVEGFEGIIHSADAADDERRVRAFLATVVEVARACAAERLFHRGRVWLSAGGSAYYDLVAAALGASGLPDVDVVLRSGCYLAHDVGAYAGAFTHIRARNDPALSLEPRAALEVWGLVQSRPEAERVIVNVGKRDIGIDLGPPKPIAWSRGPRAPAPLDGCEVVDVNDQHAHLHVPSDCPLAFGDRIALGVSHPCTTFDKWQALWVVNDAYDVIGAVRTFF